MSLIERRKLIVSPSVYVISCQYICVPVLVLVAHSKVGMQSKLLLFCCGAIAGLGSGAVGMLYKVRPQPSHDQQLDINSDQGVDSANHPLFRYSHPVHKEHMHTMHILCKIFRH